MPNNLSLEDVLNFDVATTPARQVSDTASKIKKAQEDFSFDPNISIATELDIERHREIEAIRKKASQNQQTLNFLNANDVNAQIGVDDVDGLNSVADGLGHINGVPNLSPNALETNLVKLNADKFGGVFKNMANNVNLNNNLKIAQNKNSTFETVKNFDPNKKPESKIMPSEEKGNKYINSVKRGSASMIQLGALLYDGAEYAVGKGLDKITGNTVMDDIPYKTNKVFDAMQNLKTGKYSESSQLQNLMIGAEQASQQAELNGNNQTIASLSHLAKNGSIGDLGEVLAEFAPSLYVGGIAGGVSKKVTGNLANRYVNNAIGKSIASGSIINPTRLAVVQTIAPQAVQGSVMAGVTDFVGSFPAEVGAQVGKGHNDGEAVSRALTKSLAQAGVSGLGGSLLPLRFGGDFGTLAGQSAIQGLFGYGSAYAGAKSIGEELSPTEGAINILMGAVTALPEVVMVGGTSIRKNEIESHINDLVIEQAITDTYAKQEAEENKSIYFGAVIRDLFDRVSGSKTSERSPDTLREFIKQVQSDPEATKEVYIDAEVFNQLVTEHSLDIESLFNSSPELKDGYIRANEIDGLIRIPLDEMLTTFSGISDKQFLNAFADSLKLTPESMTAGQAKTEFSKTSQDFEADISEIKKNFEAEIKKAKDIDSIAQIIRDDLSSLDNKFSQNYNSNAVSLATSFYESLAKRTGVSASDLYSAMPLRVVSNQEQASALMNADIDTFNQNKTQFTEAKTGNEITVNYGRNTVSSKNYPASMDFGQKIEPFGEYMNIDSGEFSNRQDSWEYGQITFKNPLVLEHKSTDSNGWKKDLSDMFGGKKGKALTNAVKKAGYDGIVTIDGKYGYSETVNISGKKSNGAESFNQSKTNLDSAIDAEIASLNKNDFQSHIRDKYSINLGLIEDKYNNSIEIQKIIVPDDLRGSGVGTKAMSEIIDYADQNGKTLTLTPSSDFGGNKKRLVEFYQRFGFVENKGKNKDSDFSDSMYRKPTITESFNQSSDPQVELRKIYGYRDSHLAPDAEGGYSGSQIIDAFPELNDRSFTKNYGDGFKYDAKTVKIIREMQKNPDGEIKVYRAVPDLPNINSLNFGDWVGLTKDYANEHGKSRFDGKYKVIEQTVKSSDLYTDGNSIHEWGYSPKSSDVYIARLHLNEQLKSLNEKLDQGLFKSRVSKSDVLGDKSALKNNPSIAKSFLDSKGIDLPIIENKSDLTESVSALVPELQSLEFNSDIKNNPDLLSRAFDALYLQDLRSEIDDPDASEFSKNRAFNKLVKFSDADNDKKFSLIDNKISKVKNSKSSGINEQSTRSSAIDSAKSFGDEYDKFVDSVLKDIGLDYYNQKFNDKIRGQIQFRKDKKGAVIILGKDADFSTFSHELGHHFLEMSMNFAFKDGAPDQLKADMLSLLKWSKQGSKLEDWNNLTPDQKTELHEKFAESFEQYLFTGKAPSNDLRKVFASFRVFMTAVYKNIKNFLTQQKRSDLNPEISAIMDRMLATDEAIEQVQKQRNLEFIIAQDDAMKLGISPKDYLEMVELHNEATEQAKNELEQKTIKDLAYYRTMRNKHLKSFSEQQKRVRQQVREDVAKEVAEMPIYKAIAFLKQPVERVKKAVRDPNKVDPSVDTLLEAIAKMGGIDAKEIESTWGTDKPESYKVNVGRVKKVARKDGLSIESVAERLAEDGYLSTDENGKLDVHEFENLFTDSLGGAKFYSRNADPELFMMGDDYGLAYGEMPIYPESGKLNLEWLKNKYGEESEIFKAVGKTGQYGLAMKDGLDPDMVAEMFGFDSADAMINTMANSPTPKDLINQMSGEIIKNQYSELFDEKSIEMAIDEAVHNDIRAMMLSRELTAITKLQGKQSELNEATKAIARNIIGETKVGDIRPHIFSGAELKHAKQYSIAIKNGQTTEAVRAKRQQLVNFHAVKQSYEAKNFISKLDDLIGKINGDDARIAKNRDFNLVAIARWVAGKYGLIENSKSYDEHMKNLINYDPMSANAVKDLIAPDGELFLPEQNYQEMTFNDFQTLDAVIREIWHRSKESQKIKVGDKKIAFDDAIESLVATANKKPAKSRKDKFLGFTPKAGSKINLQRSFQSLKRAEQLFTWLDDGKSNGFFHEYVFNPMQDSLASYRLEQRKMMQEVVNIYAKFDAHIGKIDASELGGKKTTFDSKQELIHAILHTGNESNKKRLIEGYEWADINADGSSDYSRFDNFIQKVMNDGVITKNDMDAIQEIWNLFDGYKSQAQEVHKNINGLYFKELPKTSLSTPYGVYEGGYIPADYDKTASVEADLLNNKNEASTTQQNLMGTGATTGANFTKSRNDNFSGYEMLLDLTQLPMHLDRELRYIHLEENLKQASKLFRNRKLMNSIEKASPYAIESVISDWLNAVANQRISDPSKHSTIDKVADTLRKNSSIVLMAGNLKNAIEAVTSLPQVMTVVPKRELMSSTAKFFAGESARSEFIKQVRELSPFMDSHLDNVSNELRYQVENMVLNPSKLKKGTDFLRNNAYIVQQVIQAPLESIVWNSAYNDAQTKGMDQGQAVHYADGVIRQYLSDMSPEGVSKIERSSPLVRTMLMFYGWFNMVHNTWSMRNKLISESDASKLSKMGQYGSLYFMFIAMPAMLSKALTLSFNGELFDNEDAEDWAEDLVNITVKSQAEMIFGMMPFARDFINPIYRQTFETTIYSDRYQVSPIGSMVENLYKSGKTASKITSGEPVDASQTTKQMLQSATFATGVPFTLIQRPATYGADVLLDGEEPKNAIDVVRGSLNGK